MIWQSSHFDRRLAWHHIHFHFIGRSSCHKILLVRIYTTYNIKYEIISICIGIGDGSLPGSNFWVHYEQPSSHSNNGCIGQGRWSTILINKSQVGHYMFGPRLIMHFRLNWDRSSIFACIFFSRHTRHLLCNTHFFQVQDGHKRTGRAPWCTRGAQIGGN